jgi:hypothetical protein
MTERRTNARPRVHQAPLAIGSDGSILLNCSHLVERGGDLDHVVRAAREQGGPIFIGVAMTAAEAKTALQALDDACAEIVARIGGRRQLRGARR